LRASAQVGAAFADSTPIAFSSTPPVAPRTDDQGGGGPPVVLIGVAVAVVFAVITAIVLIVRGRLRDHAAIKAPDPEQRVVPWAGTARRITQPPPDLMEDDSSPAEDIGEVLGLLISRAGSDVGSEYAVGGKPVSIGSGSRCAVRIDDPSLGAEEARIWIRKGLLMLHKLTRLSVIAQDGASGGWQMLEPGDTFRIGDHTFEFQLVPEDAPTEDDAPRIARESQVRAPRQRQARPAATPTPLTEMMPHNDMGVDRSRDEQAS
jgi:hypothetical protein